MSKRAAGKGSSREKQRKAAAKGSSGLSTYAHQSVLLPVREQAMPKFDVKADAE